MGSPAEVGRRIGKFQLIRSLGQGGMGQVYLARQTNLDRNVAIKILHKELAEDEVFLERFQREARAAAVFQHPNIVAVIDADADEATGEQYIAFEYVDGASLEERIKRQGPLDETVALEVVRDVAEALAYAESKGIVHRDIKPDNILIASDGAVKLADLGLAKSFDRRDTAVTKTGVIVGTPLYMAPEQALGYETVDIRADIYSLGLVLWRMLTGLVPFDEDGETSSLHILSRHINEDVPDVRSRNPAVSEATAALIRGMCARERDDRYPSAAALAAEIDRILDGEPPLGPKGAADPNRTATLSGAHVQVGPGAPTVLDGEVSSSGVRRRRRSERSTIAWAPEEAAAPRRRGRRGALLVLLLGSAGALAALRSPDLLAKLRPGADPAVTATAVDSGSGTSRPGPDSAGADSGSTASGPTQPSGGGALAEPAVEPRRPAVTPPSLEDEPALLAFLRKTTRLLFVRTEEGLAHVEALRVLARRSDNVSLRAYLAALEAGLRLLDEELDEEAHDAARRDLRQAAQKHRKRVIPGKVAATVDDLLDHWLAFAAGLRRLYLALSDPRAQKPALRQLAGLPSAYGLEGQARRVLELCDAVDFYARWSTDAKRRAEVASMRKRFLADLAPTAVGTALRGELRVLGSLLHQLLTDEQRSLLSALYVVAQTPDGKRSRFLRARRRVVPRGASLRRMPARGLVVELPGPWQPGQRLEIEVGGQTFRFDRTGLNGQRVRWGPRPAVLVEPRSKDLLLRLPDAQPGEFSQPYERRVGRPRFSVSTHKLELRRVLLVLLPSRGAS
ncbi:MAG: serine/threonine protein kinase [Planctomycetota bacterium]|nr:MAG: serine/threonine protein kinase [Planctomycetota bacterium]